MRPAPVRDAVRSAWSLLPQSICYTGHKCGPVIEDGDSHTLLFACVCAGSLHAQSSAVASPAAASPAAESTTRWAARARRNRSFLFRSLPRAITPKLPIISTCGKRRADRAKDGPAFSAQLEDCWMTPFDIATLSRAPEGDLSDGLGGNFEHLDKGAAEARSARLAELAGSVR